MQTKPWRQIETLYRAALERPPEGRPAFLESACAGDEKLLREVQSLLAYAERAESFLEVSAIEVEAQSTARDTRIFASGQTLSHYQITEKIGEGGMGQVYRARDTRLDRDVAIKVSTEHFSEGFEREARLVAALNHLNICTLYDVGPDYLVMEFVEGETLAERIQREPVPMDEAKNIARQIAEALEAAHEKGIVHRDLKPANVKIKPDGTVKVLDFGVAIRDRGEAARTSGELQTFVGFDAHSGIIGTAEYMAPEQARGKPVDKRVDIWAFGAVLYEMFSGYPPFAAATISATIEAVLQQEPDWTRLPRQVRRLIQRCLEKDPKRRLRDIGDAHWELEQMGITSDEAIDPTQKRSASRRTYWAAAAVLVVALVAVSAWRIKSASDEPMRRFELPIHTLLAALSPDGTRIAYFADGHLQIRALDSLQPQDAGAWPNPGVAADGNGIMWSPDSKSIAFATDGMIRSVPVSGGAAYTICKIPASGRILGGLWRRDGTIVFSVWRDSLYTVPVTGGTPQIHLKIDPATEIDFHRISALPDDRLIVMTHLRGDPPFRTEVFDGQHRRVLTADASVQQLSYVLPGYIVFARRGPNSGIWAMPFSEGSLDLNRAVRVQTGAAPMPAFFDSARNGTMLAFMPPGVPKMDLVSVDRGGAVNRIAGDPIALRADPRSLTLSPDGRRLLFVAGESRGSLDLFVRELATGLDTRLTFDQTDKLAPSWFHSGEQVIYSVAGNIEAGKIITRLVNGSTNSREIAAGVMGRVFPDGRHIVYLRDERGRGHLLYSVLAADGSVGPPQEVFHEKEDVDVMTFDLSPDGDYIAYSAHTPGVDLTVFMTQFPDANARWQVSSQPEASFPHFSRDGRELFYATPSPSRKLWSVTINPQPTVKLGAPRVIVDMTKPEATGLTVAGGYDLSPDGKRVLMERSLPGNEVDNFHVVLIQNWLTALKQ